jgi:CRISPR/Cas system-associated exonuclease Cas4 (RecB family)
VTPIENPKFQISDSEERETLPLSLLNDLLYCPRRAALKAVEGVRSENKHTVLGDIVHEHADLPGYEVAKGVTLLRALPVWSERLGLSGKCDVVEVHPHLTSGHPLHEPEDIQHSTFNAQHPMKAGPSPHPDPLPSHQNGSGEGTASGRHPYSEARRASAGSGVQCANSSGNSLASDGRGIGALVPVEYKKGKRRAFENDDAQLCAQALCLEEMLGRQIERGAVFHAASKRRREVEFTPELRALVERSLGELRGLLDSQRVPPAIFKPACEECSLFEICLPKAAGEDSRAERLARQIFQI